LSCPREAQKELNQLRKSSSAARVVFTRRVARAAVELRHNLSAYDAVYVALAEVLDTRVLTCDGRLASPDAQHCFVSSHAGRKNSGQRDIRLNRTDQKNVALKKFVELRILCAICVI
jgi:hypothetical protein